MNRRLIVVLLMLLQMTTGAQVSVIRGTVVDEANAVIPGAEVRLEHLETGEKKTAFSSEVGAFSFLNVRQGKVRITVRLPGFQNWSQEVQLGHEELRLTVPLHVASASTPLINTRVKLPPRPRTVIWRPSPASREIATPGMR